MQQGHVAAVAKKLATKDSAELWRSFHKDTSERVRVQKQGARGDLVAIVVPGKNTERQICQLPKSDLAQRCCAGELDPGSMCRARDALLLPKMPKKRTSEAAEDALPTKRPRVETVDVLSLTSPSFEEQLVAHF